MIVDSTASVLAAESSFVQPRMSIAAIPETITPTFSSFCYDRDRSSVDNVSTEHWRIARSVVINNQNLTNTSVYDESYASSINPPKFANLLPMFLLQECDDSKINYKALSSTGSVTGRHEM